MSDAVIEMVQAVKEYHGQAAVRGMDLQIPRGQAFALLGPNGAGKTTSIAMMLGLTRPSRGKVRLFGQNPQAARSHENIGVMLQTVSVADRLTVSESLNLFRGFYARPLPLDHLLSIAGLEGDARKMAGKLSGGKTRRLQFAIAMAGDPQAVFLDEPTAGMDVSSKRHFWEALRVFIAENKTLVLTTHDLQEADVVADRVVVMNSGEVIADATPAQIKMEFGGRQISFVTDSPQKAQELKRWDNVLDVHVAGRQVTLHTQDSDTLLRQLIQQNWEMKDILVSGGSLEEAFVHMTQEMEEDP